jgi:hypothetical protein
MRRSTFVIAPFALAVIVAGVWAAPTVAVAGRKQPLTCPSAHAKVIAADRQAVVYEAPRPPEEREPEFFLIFACAHGHGRYALGKRAAFGPEGGGGVASETLSGAMVAYENSLAEPFPEPGHDSFVIFVRDLLTGRIVHEAPTAETKFPGDVGKGQAEKIVLKRDGAVAWIGLTVLKPTEYQVHAVDETGSRLLAAGGDIVPRSLTLQGSTLRWIQNGKPTYAILH